MRGYLYVPRFVAPTDREELLAYLAGLVPLWEYRFPTNRPPPRGEQQRMLLRPVYWLGNWQFACLGYYHPRHRRTNSAVQAEPFPPVLARLVQEIEARIRRQFLAADIPEGWQLNTCLINFYGGRVEGGREVDVARVGSHADDEPGPVASLSLGERALLQFVARGARDQRPVKSEWLEDSSLQSFAGVYFKETLLHRVQRVEDRQKLSLPPRLEGWRTRRINLTLRYVPPQDILPYARLKPQARLDVMEYVRVLSGGSPFWAAQEPEPGGDQE